MLDYRMYRILKEPFTYDEFRSEVYHFLNNNTVKDYIYQIINYTIIQSLYHKEEYAKALFLLALYDYFCKEYNVDGSVFFTELHSQRLKNKQYPDSVIAECKITKTDAPIIAIEEKCKSNYYSSFFLKYNIYEYCEVENKYME